MEKNLFGIICAVVFLSGSAALALDPMGPPAAGLGRGKWGIGAEYSYSDMDIERQVASYSGGKRTMNFEMHKLYANIGYGIADNVEGFVRVGMAGTDVERKTDWTKWSGDSDWDFAWGGGFKATLCESPEIAWGLIAQYSWLDLDGSYKSSFDGDKRDWSCKLDELQIAVGPTWKAAEGVKIYGGPFLHFVRGNWYDDVDGSIERKPIEEESWLGGYIGTAIDMPNNTNLTVEYIFTGDAWAVAGGICWRM